MMNRENMQIESGDSKFRCPRLPKNCPPENPNEYFVLNEVGEDSDSGSGSDVEYKKYDNVPVEEIDAMLEEDLPDDYKGERKKKETSYVKITKVLLEEKGGDHFDVLPVGWLMVMHFSGMPLYLHRSTRVCTMARPYLLGPANVKKHEIPLSAIPCYSYKRALIEEQKQSIKMETDNPDEVIEIFDDDDDINIKSASESPTKKFKSNEEQSKIVNKNLLRKLLNSEDEEKKKAAMAKMPSAKVETAQEAWKNYNLSHEEVTNYCKKLFKFKYIPAMRFNTWDDRKKYQKVKKALRRPTLPEDTKLISVPIRTAIPGDKTQATEREFLMNPKGKSYVCILHEYLQKIMKKQPNYEVKTLDNDTTPFSTTVIINGMRYGVGYGTSKRASKIAAAKASLEILIPDMREKISQDEEEQPGKTTEQDLAFFDDISIEDPRVMELCAKTMEPTPYTILQTCLERNFGIDDREITCELISITPKRNQFKMTFGKHTATVECKNKKEGKQRASQVILQHLHPNITSWGSILRLYGTQSSKTSREKKLEQKQITSLQSKAKINEPNYEILNKLCIEMTKLSERDKKREQEAAAVAAGKLVFDPDNPPQSHSKTKYFNY